nr:Gag-Pol polyprotein, putative [Tanacetum cinerariifolium]
MPPRKNVNHRDLRDVEIDDLRRQVQQLQEIARVKVVNEEGEVHDDDSDGKEEYENPFGSSSAFDSGHSSRQHRRIQPHEFLDWLHTVKKVFDFKEVSEDQKVKLVAIKLRKHMRRVRDGRKTIRTWEKMKRELKRSNVVQLQPYWTYADVCKLAVKVEKQQKEKRGSFTRSFNKEGSTSSGKTPVIALKVCNVIIDGGSCSNVVATNMVEKLQLKTEDHPRPYNIHWVRKGNEVKVNKRVIHDGYKNTYSFITNGARVVLTPLKPKTLLPCAKEKDVSFISGACIEKKMFESQMGYVMVVMEESRSRIVEHNPLVRTILEDFKDVIPNKIPTGLPPMREVQHCIDLVPGSVLPNKAAYHMNPKEHEELQRQVDELLKKGVLQESKSPCDVPALLVPKKMALGVCVWIVGLLTGSPSNIGFLYLVLMISDWRFSTL